MEQFRQFKPHPLLPEESILILNTSKSILSLISKGNLIEQQAATPLEISLITALLERYPDYCGNEILLSILTHKSVDVCRQQLLNAMEEKTMRAATKRLREMIVRCRKRLYPFKIDIVTLLGRGYILEPLNRKVPFHQFHPEVPV